MHKVDSVFTPLRIVVDPTMNILNLVLTKRENNIGNISIIMICSRVKRYI